MERLSAIVVAVIIGLLWLLFFSINLKKENFKNFCIENECMQPNCICYWRVPIGWLGIWLYFFTSFSSWGIIVFTFSAFLDATDGQVARACGLITKWGKELDPLADKLTYLPAIFIFGHRGNLNLFLVLIFINIEILGQFIIRGVAKKFKLSVAANNFGKIKACLCFALIIYLALLDDGLNIPNFSHEMLLACIFMGIASCLFKLIPNRLYADILSFLNFICGIIGIYQAFNYHFVYATLAVLAGQIFDLFDGRMAQKHGGTKYGPYFDDIADFVSFGLCPFVIISVHGNWSYLSITFGLIYLLTVAYRLWRFTYVDKLNETLQFGEVFNGLPSPAGVMIILGASLLCKTSLYFTIAVSIAGLLMISKLRFVHFGRYILPRVSRTIVIVIGVTVMIIIAYLIKMRDPVLVGRSLVALVLFYILAFNLKVLNLKK